MHRWFFADEEIVCRGATPPSSPYDTQKTSSSTYIPDIDWLFKVKFDWKLCPNECLAICGSCPSLGEWDPQSSLPLMESEEEPTIWTLSLPLPRGIDIRYRYLVYALNHKGNKIVRFWETHFEARHITPDQMHDIQTIVNETFGILRNKQKIDRGWLNPYVTVIQFKFYNAPFVLNTKHAQLLLYVKVTPLRLTAREKCEKEPKSPISNAEALEASETTYGTYESEDLSQTFAFCEVVSLEEENGQFRKQPKYGTACGPEDLIMFNLTLDDIAHTAYSIDLYDYAPKSGSDVPPNHFGYQYILPENIQNSEGTLHLVIMCGTKHRPIGCMKCDYLVVKPLPRHNFNLEKTCQRYWSENDKGTLIGHRGCGRSFWLGNDILRENCLWSLYLATKHGADMIEFDVQLTKDMVPILFHDFNVNVSNTLSFDNQENDVMYLFLTQNEIDALKPLGMRIKKDIISFPVGALTLEQLRRVKVYKPPKEKGHQTNCASDTKDNRPFIPLEQVFKEIDAKIEFLIDIKWPQKVTGELQRESALKTFDKNDYIDTILRVVFKNVTSRRIVFSSFDADICTMVRLKQNIYPIFFLVQDQAKEVKFVDPRGKSVSAGICFAKAMELLGITAKCADLKQLPGKVLDLHKQHLRVFTWGTETRTEATLKYLKALGVDGILCDRINHVVEPEDLKENIFYIVPMPDSPPVN